MTGTAIPFRKMNGLGNAFAVFDARRTPVSLSADAIRRLGGAEGIGFDQMITIEAATGGGDAFMRIHNRDGGEVEACGNATRCVGWLLMGETGQSQADVETAAGLLQTFATGDPRTITVDMGRPRFGWQDIPLAEPTADTRAIPLAVGPADVPILSGPSAVNMGNPHAIFWVNDVNAYDLADFGPKLEHDPLFPERANISLAKVESRSALTVRTWERGVGLTRACGTAACASAVAAARKDLTGREVTVTLPGGPLQIIWNAEDHVMMTGPITDEFVGEIDPNTLAWRRVERSAA
ncbi:diaminopimelate epimerase [Bauldia sp.]|uniref:diaminopimelate epimerase n=1 Tax=Bauldia sp. TaxID=2575872 RepID=UPI003BA99A30